MDDASSKALSLCLWLITVLPAHGADKMTFQDCLTEAASKSYEVQAAEHALDRARAQYHAGYSPFLPQVSADASYERGNASGFGVTTGTREEYAYGLSLQQSLFAGFRDKGTLDRLRLELEVAEARLELARAKLSGDVRRAYADALYGVDLIELTKGIATRRRSNVELVELRFESGRENKGSFLRIRAYLKQAEFEMAQAQRALGVAQRNLLRLLARPLSSSVEVGGRLTPPALVPVSDFPSRAKETPHYLVLVNEAKAAEKAVTIAGSRFFPELAVTGAVGKRGAAFPPTNDRWSVGVVLSFPFFPGAKNIFEYQAARADEERARVTLKNAEDELTVRLQEAHAALADAIGRTEVQEQFFQAAQLRADVGRTKYTSGLLTFEDWDLIENDLIATQKSRLQSLRDAWSAEGAWEEAVGKGIVP